MFRRTSKSKKYSVKIGADFEVHSFEEERDIIMDASKFLMIGAGITFISSLMAMGWFIPNPTIFQYEVFKLVASLSGAAFALGLTGLLDVKFPLFKKGSVKASGAFAVFCLIYFFSPAVIAQQ
jgi:hypothetical protein